MQNKPRRDRTFVSSKLPWIIAAVALLVYLLTVNHWLSFESLGTISYRAGWLWGADVLSPLHYLLTFPFRWLPGKWMPFAYNLFSVGCATGALGLLARSVTLLPHDRTESQRMREQSRHALLSIPTAWIPPVLAAIVCGLQFNFWQISTAGATDMLDVLLLGYVVRCFLEYRVSERDHWLMQATLVQAVGMANGWLLFSAFPLFLVALIWSKRLEFFQLRFLFRLFVCLAIGLLLFLVQPIIQVLSSEQVFSFWQALKMALSLDKNIFLYLAGRAPSKLLLIVAVTSLLPLLIISVRWASNFGDPSRMGSALARWIFHLTHGALLLVCLWVALDPNFSLRSLSTVVPSLQSLGALIAASHYLSALSVGYLTGYFLLVFRPVPIRMERPSVINFWLNRVSVSVIVLLLLLLPTALLYLNLGQIRVTNGPALKQYASVLSGNIPPNGIVLSDDSRKLALAQAYLAREGRELNAVFLHTRTLPYFQYQRYLQRKYPNDWPDQIKSRSTNQVDDLTLMRMILSFSERKPIHYLHPSFGYYFEAFDQRLRGIGFDLVPFPTNSLSGPPLSEAEINANQQFWGAVRPVTDALVPFISPPPFTTNISLQTVLLDQLKIPFHENVTATTLGALYSQALDFWGVQLQRADKLPEAQRCFRDALELNPDNIAARENLDLNRELHAGRKQEVRLPKTIDEELGKYRGWEQALSETGPFDDPTHCFGLGVTFAQGRLFRQSAQQLERVHQLVPDNYSVRLWLARLYTYNRLPEKALELVHGVKFPDSAFVESGFQRMDVLQTEVSALYAANRTDEADQLLEEAMKNDPGNTNLLSGIIRVAAAFNRVTNALAAVDRLVAINPDNVNTLVARGLLYIQVGRHLQALQSLDHALDIQSNNFQARLLRAIAYLGSDRVEEAASDYKDLQVLFPNSNEVNSGLGEIAWRQKDTNTAIHYYSLCLSNTYPESEQGKFLRERLKSLQPESPP